MKKYFKLLGVFLIVTILVVIIRKQFFKFEGFDETKSELTGKGTIKIPGDLEVDGKLFVNNDPLDRKNIKLLMYPIGSIFISTLDKDPGGVIGGKWERFAKGRTLIGVDESDTSFASGITGGAKKHTLTLDEMPSHNHSYSDRYVNFRTAWVGFPSQGGNQQERNYVTSKKTTSELGGNKPHNNMPPYISVFMFKRIA